MVKLGLDRNEILHSNIEYIEFIVAKFQAQLRDKEITKIRIIKLISIY